MQKAETHAKQAVRLDPRLPQAQLALGRVFVRFPDRYRESIRAVLAHSWYALVKHPWLQSLQGDPEFQEIVAAIKADLDDVRDEVIGVYQLICR